MTQYATVNAAATVLEHRTVCSGRASELELMANQALASMYTAGARVLVSAELSGGGDGNEYSITLEATTVVNLGSNFYQGDDSAAILPELGLCEIFVFEVGSPRDVDTQWNIALGRVSGAVYSTDLAGTSKGQNVGGMIVAAHGPR
ncbi:MAG: hypothetical protein WC803_13525 [Sphingomonas sp.]|jgi:hypothetical protein